MAPEDILLSDESEWGVFFNYPTQFASNLSSFYLCGFGSLFGIRLFGYPDIDTPLNRKRKMGLKKSRLHELPYTEIIKSGTFLLASGARGVYTAKKFN